MPIGEEFYCAKTCRVSPRDLVAFCRYCREIYTIDGPHKVASLCNQQCAILILCIIPGSMLQRARINRSSSITKIGPILCGYSKSELRAIFPIIFGSHFVTLCWLTEKVGKISGFREEKSNKGGFCSELPPNLTLIAKISIAGGKHFSKCRKFGNFSGLCCSFWRPNVNLFCSLFSTNMDQQVFLPD